MRSSARKQIRRERRQALESGFTIETLNGHELSEEDWFFIYRFYRNTTGRKGAIDYLTQEFFEQIRTTFAEHAVVSMARHEGTPVATSLSFEAGKHLYGRYWGATQYHEGVHFELCYYQLIERAISHGYTRFEAGAQGSHKLKRGLLASPTYSAHWLAHEGLRDAVAKNLYYEARSAQAEINMYGEHSPYKRSPQT
jgi:hypothetical protein